MNKDISWDVDKGKGKGVGFQAVEMLGVCFRQ